MKKAKTNKISWFWRLMNFLIGNYFRLKAKIFKPEIKMRDGLYPASYMQQQILSKANAMLAAKGITGRTARRIIEKEFKFKVIPKGK